MTKRPKPPSGFEENPEWTADNFSRARPFREVFPDQFEAWSRRERPPVPVPKVHVSFRLPAELANAIRATGKGYTARVEQVLREALESGRL